MQNIDYIFKIVLIGGQGVGKSSLMTRFVDQMYNESYLSTIGVDFKIKTIEIKNKRIKIQIWDTAGQERFSALTQQHFKGAHGCICVFDIGVSQTLNQAQTYLKLVTEEYNIHPESCYLVANKIDLNKREISSETGQILANSLGVQYIETSAKENLQVNELFEGLAESILKLVDLNITTPQIPDNTKKIGIKSEEIIQNNRCC